MEKEKKVIIYSIIGMLLLKGIGITYAYFSAQITGNESSATISTTSGTMTIVYDNGSGILTSSNITPDATPFATKIFTLTGTNTTDKIMPYTLSLIIDNNTFSTGAITYTLESTNTGSNGSVVPSITAQKGITSAKEVLGTGIFSNATSKVHTYILKLYFPETNENQNADMGKSFAAHIGIESGESYNSIFGIDTSGANAPVLATNMIPVYYDETNDLWKKADSTNPNTTYKWYDYTSQMWANAVTVTSGTRSTYTSAAVGTTVNMSDIMGFWVWIPRYEYKITNSGTTLTAEQINVNFISGTSTTNISGYLIHPAFRNGTVYKNTADYDLGGWDKELTGIWYGKFETGYATNFTSTTGAITSNILIKPDVYSMKYQTVSNEYTTIQNIQSDHGIGSTVETHMSKNDEWGAVAYLSQSAYGKYGNTSYTGANKEIYVNNAYYSTGPIYTTGRSNGTYSGGTGSGTAQYGTYEYNNCPASAYTHTTCTEAVRNTNTTKGTGASTTGNIYGVYDMSGGADEYVMANLSGTISSSGFSSMPAQKYWNKYTSTTQASACNGSSCYGQAITETSGWYNDYMNFVTSSLPWAVRGFSAYSASDTNAGVFGFSG